eukprot:CAMPEP_0169123186 /NCGR_PEP_ID=MMETSP1015-20121227/33649_1 /TAXON_ID=342587 /ORGANISM="Karlodinium micrum, Strain CCMP2283" /LENGTH=161 /DNA_ID=CAMNT_0009186503 /DNA_START=106 /DNA_END=591 /DNA_ORIENTATION=-
MYPHLSQEVRDSCILFLGSERKNLFGKTTPEYDAFIEEKMERGKVHLLKPEDWRPGQPCSFEEASEFFVQLGYGALPLDMKIYEEKLDMDNLLKESKGQFCGGKDAALRQIEQNFAEALLGRGCYGHDYGPVLEMLHLADERLFPILNKAGLDEYLQKCKA